MNEAVQSIGPPRKNCHIPMTFHSVQEVQTSAGHELMQVLNARNVTSSPPFMVSLLPPTIKHSQGLSLPGQFSATMAALHATS